MRTFPWTQFLVFVAAGLIGTAAVIPYSLSMNQKALEKLKASGRSAESGVKKLPPIPVMVLLSTVQGLLLVGIATFVGLLAAGQVGLGAPVLEAALAGRSVADQILALLPVTLLLAIVSGVVMMALEAWYFMPRLPRQLSGVDHRTAFWKRVLACFYGGIAEEILLRLFAMSVLVWLLGLVWKTPTGAAAAGAVWTANILAALLFGAGHLPATATNAKLTPIVVFRALLLNGIPGVACGYLYVRYGLEAAMICHFSLDILIHLIMVPFMKRRAEKIWSEPIPQTP